MSPRPTPPAAPLLLAALAALLALGCALTSKSDPGVPRFFSPESSSEGTPRAAPAPASAPAAELRLGRVTGASYLDDRLVYRDSDYELGYYQERRWTEAPEQYLKRRLSRVLFEERGVRRVVGGAAPTLEVELVAFEEIRAPRRLARVRVVARLSDQRAVRWEETLTVDQPLAGVEQGDAADRMVAALGLALRAVVDRIGERVAAELALAALAPARAAPGDRRPPTPRPGP
jgi:cholesterol transport system auxiliary component